MRSWSVIIPFLATLSLAAQSYAPKDWQIKTAVLAAPEYERENATVMGYTSDGELTVPREGSNDLICLADDPARKGFSVACNHESLESFMDRGRALRAKGKTNKEIFQIREDEVKAGKLEMPDRALLVVTTALPPAPAGPGAPWIMDAGTHRAHIMITPPKNK
ncbi:MAG: hypothetical protein VYC82_01235 [Verrucomicrobiota bacterium]|nr:hypothetical protein [Verrucomicrobiota bacterium]